MELLVEAEVLIHLQLGINIGFPLWQRNVSAGDFSL